MIASCQTLKRMKPIADMVERSQSHGMTYGLSPAGYDVRIAERLTLKRGGFALASTVEKFEMPLNLLGIVHDKSTWARQGLALQNTVVEPGWRGFLTLELSNHSSAALKIERGMPIAQIVFHLLDKPTKQPYAGKYQDQAAGPQRAILSSDNGGSCHAGICSAEDCVVCGDQS